MYNTLTKNGVLILVNSLTSTNHSISINNKHCVKYVKVRVSPDPLFVIQREKCPNTEFFLARIFLCSGYSIRI